MKKVLYTGGTFDLFHFGHQNFLKQCRNIADEVVVSLNTDEFVERFKGFKPILSYKEREQSLNYCKFVDRVIRNDAGEDSRACILTVRPQIIAIGDDWAHKDYYKQMSFDQQWLDDNQITLVYIPYTRGISTTEIKKRIINAHEE
tara:strand:- start:102 stop:536 length:435 start_codon:yes stop_codon:yes gene_type:complete